MTSPDSKIIARVSELTSSELIDAYSSGERIALGELQKQLVRVVPDLLNAPVLAGRIKVQKAWEGTAVVAIVDRHANLRGLYLHGDLDDYQKHKKLGYWAHQRPAVAKALYRMALETVDIHGGIRGNWDWLREQCGYEYHSGDAVSRLPSGEEIYIGTTLCEATIPHLAAELDMEPTPLTMKLLAAIPESYYVQAGFFDSKFAAMVSNTLSGKNNPLPAVSLEHWNANS